MKAEIETGTPETDIEEYPEAISKLPVVPADFARKLERERKLAFAELKYIADAGLSARQLETIARDFLARHSPSLAQN